MGSAPNPPPPGPRRGLSGSPWWPDLTPASAPGRPALRLPPRQAGAQTRPLSAALSMLRPEPRPAFKFSLFFFFTFELVAIKDWAGQDPLWQPPGLDSQEKPTSAFLHPPSPYLLTPAPTRHRGERSPCGPPGPLPQMGDARGKHPCLVWGLPLSIPSWWFPQVLVFGSRDLFFFYR